MTGVWDSLLVKLVEDEVIEKQTNEYLNCLLEKRLTIGNLVEEIDLLYTLPKYKGYSPVFLLKKKILKRICFNAE